MGEIYRARDTKLKRDLALKVLPATFARDPHRLVRLQCEAELLASLKHTPAPPFYGDENRSLAKPIGNHRRSRSP
jgi:serine/threonine-protein kinase